MTAPPAPPLSDPDAFSRAYRKLAPVALAAARGVVHDRAIAEEVVQEVFAALWERPGRWDPDRGSLAVYVRVVARSRAIDAWRRAAPGRTDQTLAAEGFDMPSSDPGPEERLLRRERAERLQSVLQTVPQRQREALLLQHVAGLSASEIAERTQVPLGTAKGRVRLGAERTRRGVLAAA